MPKSRQIGSGTEYAQSMAELKNWNIDRVLTAQNSYTGPAHAGPLFQWEALNKLDELANQYRNGDKFALMQAIVKCAQVDLPLPEWTTKAFMQGYYGVLHAKFSSWDEAFGSPHPKGKHLNKARSDFRDFPRVHKLVREMRARPNPPPLDDAFFEEVGKALGMGKTRAKRLYYGK